MASFEDWLPLLGEVLGVPPGALPASAANCSFVALGGTSLNALQLLSLGQLRLSRSAHSARLLGDEPVGEVLLAATPYEDSAPVVRGEELRPLLPGQRAMLAAHLAGVDQPYHLMFTLETGDPLDPVRTADALQGLVARNESLRTIFVAEGQTQARRVLPVDDPVRLLHQQLGGSPTVRTVQELYARTAGTLLRPFERPPVVFVLSPAGEGGLLTMLIHHVLADGWSVGLLWRQFARLYRDGPESVATWGQSPERLAARHAAMTASGALAAAVDRVTSRLAGAPREVVLPTDGVRPEEGDGQGARLVFELGEQAADAVTELTRRSAATRTTVLLAAWALTVARRTGLADLVLGLPVSGRFGAAASEIVGLCTRVVPVRCRIDDDATAEQFVGGVGRALVEAVNDADLPFEELTGALGEDSGPVRNPLVQIGFAAHEELIPETLAPSWRLYEGHCGGAVFDALLYLQSWSDRPRLALEYSSAALSPVDAGELADSFEAALLELGRNPRASLGTVRTISARQYDLLRRRGAGAAVVTEDDIWQAFHRRVVSSPDAVAVSDTHAGIELTYAQLAASSQQRARVLAEAGVVAGDRVLIDLPRSAEEAIAVLAVLRLGAAYVSIDGSATEQWRSQVIRTAAPRARIGPDSVVELLGSAAGEAGVAGPAGPAATAYLAFTSGSTGLPKAVVIPHRAVLRLAADPGLFAAGGRVRMLRLAPLAFDASTLELLVPLVRGDTVEVFPPEDAAPAALAGFLRSVPVTHAWLTAGLFHLVADHRPDAFLGLRQLFTGGGVVSARHVRRVLEHCGGLSVTNGYGPTENTTFTTTYSVDGAHQVGHDLPIGRPVAGTGVVVLDARRGLVPPGAIGDLHTTGIGLAHGYLSGDGVADTAFAPLPDSGVRAYRTGDLARWDTDGMLRFHGRADRQVKIAGHRVELADVERRVAEQPGVLDAVVFMPDGLRIWAAVRPALTEEALAVLRHAIEAGLPPQARPQRWLAMAEFPLNRNGKVDVGALATASMVVRSSREAPEEDVTAVEKLVSEAWGIVLGTDDFDRDEAFFDVGGDSLRLAQVRNLLRERLPGRAVGLTDLYRYPTVESLARHLSAPVRGR